MIGQWVRMPSHIDRAFPQETFMIVVIAPDDRVFFLFNGI